MCGTATYSACSVNKLLDEGIYIKQGKTNKAQIKRWTPRLRAAVELALKQQVTHNLLYVFADPKGIKFQLYACVTGTPLPKPRHKRPTLL